MGCRERAGEKDALPLFVLVFLMGSSGVLCNINPRKRANENCFFQRIYFQYFVWVLHLFFFNSFVDKDVCNVTQVTVL